MTKKSLEFFNSLFSQYPNIAILHIGYECGEVFEQLQNIAIKLDGKLTHKKLEDIDEKRFRLIAREFEYVVVGDILDKIEDKKKFLTTLYHSLENSAQIIVLSQKNKMDPFTLTSLLDEVDFLAINNIDIFDKYNLVIGKKMHMWGSGL